MSVAVLIITHESIGQVLLETAEATLGFCPLTAHVIGVDRTCDPDKKLHQALNILEQEKDCEAMLVLTDMYGSTPSNIACRLLETPKVRVVSGVNLPMLIRVFNYPDLGIDELVEKAVSGGREGIMDCRDIT
jgi:PTS system ascorbate-specific IIA component